MADLAKSLASWFEEGAKAASSATGARTRKRSRRQPGPAAPASEAPAPPDGQDIPVDDIAATAPELSDSSPSEHIEPLWTPPQASWLQDVLSHVATACAEATARAEATAAAAEKKADAAVDAARAVGARQNEFAHQTAEDLKRMQTASMEAHAASGAKIAALEARVAELQAAPPASSSTPAAPPPAAAQPQDAPLANHAVIAGLGWDLVAPTLLERARLVLTQAAVADTTYGSLTAMVGGRARRGSACELLFNSAEDLLKASLAVRSLGHSFGGDRFVFLDRKRSRDAARQIRVRRLAVELLAEYARASMDDAPVTTSGNVLLIGGVRYAHLTDGGLRWLPASARMTQADKDHITALLASA